MKITKYIHSCLLIENAADKILFDPGLFSFVEGKVKPSQFKDLSAVIHSLLPADGGENFLDLTRRIRVKH